MNVYVSNYALGKLAKHSLIEPRLATSYFTIRGKSLPIYISKFEHRGVHLIK